jgi:hypothetical protein
MGEGWSFPSGGKSLYQGYAAVHKPHATLKFSERLTEVTVMNTRVGSHRWNNVDCPVTIRPEN